MSDSYYELLGVEPEAAEEQIETAYREAVKQVHPDKNGDPDAKERFMRVQEARDVLLDPVKRARYDRHRNTNSEEREHNHEYDRNHEHDRHQERNEQTQQRHRNWNTDQQKRSRTPTERKRWRWRGRGYGAARTPMTVLVVVWEWISSLVGNARRGIGMFLRVLRCPTACSVDRALLRSLVFSPTGVRLEATLALVFVLTIVVRWLGYSPRESPMLGLGLVLVGLVGSYSGYGLLSTYPFGSRTRKRYKPDGKRRIWPIAATNLLGVGLVVLAFAGGAPTGGIVFTGTLCLSFVVPLLFYSGAQPTGIEFRRTTTVIQYVFGSVQRFLSLLTMGIVVLVVFTEWGIQTPTVLEKWMITASPWFGDSTHTVGFVYTGLLLNFLAGIVMFACILWSMYAMCRHLTAVPWIDRYDHGYHVRPGPWNLLITGPFVVCVWMILAGVPTIDVPLGLSTLTLTQQKFVTALFVLPSALTGLYILRRHLEPVFHP